MEKHSQFFLRILLCLCVYLALLCGCEAPASTGASLFTEPATQPAPEPESTVPPEVTGIATKHDQIQQKIAEIARKYGAVGVQVAVIENGRVADDFAYGWAQWQEKPMTPNTKIRVASLSKIAVGMAAAALVDEGAVELDADISRYWGVQVKNAYYPGIPITLRMLLNHTSSMNEQADEADVSAAAIRKRLTGAAFNGRRPGAVGSYDYCNYGFRVLGVTLELAGNRTLDQILKAKFYDPLGIDIAFAAGDLQNPSPIATLYRSNGEVAMSADALRDRHNTTVPGGDGRYYAGNLTASARDFAKLLAVLVNDGAYEGQQLLSAATVAQLESCLPEKVYDGSYQAQPMVCRPGLYGQETVYYHTGSAWGAYNCASYDPTTGCGVVVLTTGAAEGYDRNGIYSICSEINAYIYDLID